MKMVLSFFFCFLGTQGVLAESSSHQAASHSGDQSHSVSTGTDPQVALKWLRNGNIRFQKQHLRADGQSKRDIKNLTQGQKPHSIVISCSDSRVPPEIVFDQKLGEIFVVRTAGQSLDQNAVGSIEYAVEHLGTRNILVLGHTQCGAVKAAYATLNGKDAGSDNLNHLVKDIHPRLETLPNIQTRKPSSDYSTESWANVEGVKKDLVSRSKILKKSISEGHIQIVGAMYVLDTGLVEFDQKIDNLK